MNHAERCETAIRSLRGSGLSDLGRICLLAYASDGTNLGWNTACDIMSRAIYTGVDVTCADSVAAAYLESRQWWQSTREKYRSDRPDLADKPELPKSLHRSQAIGKYRGVPSEPRGRDPMVPVTGTAGPRPDDTRAWSGEMAKLARLFARLAREKVAAEQPTPRPVGAVSGHHSRLGAYHARPGNRRKRR